MVKNADDFMIEKYSQIAQAFFALHVQKNQLLQNYLTLMKAGSTALGIASQVLLHENYEVVKLWTRAVIFRLCKT